MTARTIPELTQAEISRFHSKIQNGPGCHLWQGTDINSQGYGRFNIYRRDKRVRILAHRLAFKLATGTDPGDKVVRHNCDIPPCCNPSCLTVGTIADNIHDAMERGRMKLAGLEAFREARTIRIAARITDGRKRCCDCKVIKNFAAFSKHRSSIDGHQYICKSCFALRRACSKAEAS